MSYNPKSNKLSPTLLDEMKDFEWKKKTRQFANYYDKKAFSCSPVDKVHKEMDNLFELLSDPLKKLHVKYLSKVSNSCYPEKHMAEDWTNLEQIQLCREMQKEKVFGAFLKSVH